MRSWWCVSGWKWGEKCNIPSPFLLQPKPTYCLRAISLKQIRTCSRWVVSALAWKYGCGLMLSHLQPKWGPFGLWSLLSVDEKDNYQKQLQLMTWAHQTWEMQIWMSLQQWWHSAHCHHAVTFDWYTVERLFSMKNMLGGGLRRKGRIETLFLPSAPTFHPENHRGSPLVLRISAHFLECFNSFKAKELIDSMNSLL